MGVKSTDAELLGAAHERPGGSRRVLRPLRDGGRLLLREALSRHRHRVGVDRRDVAEVVVQCHRGTVVREPVAWLFAIAQAKLADLYRRRRGRRPRAPRLGIGPVGAEDEQLERVEAMLAETRGVLLEVVLSDLPDVERAAVIARVVEKPYAEIASTAATSEQVIRKRVSRALGRLRARLGETPCRCCQELRTELVGAMDRGPRRRARRRWRWPAPRSCRRRSSPLCWCGRPVPRIRRRRTWPTRPRPSSSRPPVAWTATPAPTRPRSRTSAA